MQDMARQDCAVNVANRRGRALCSGVFGLPCDRLTASFCAFFVVPSLDCSATWAGELVQEDFRREEARAADPSEVADEAEQKRFDNSGVVAEIRMKGASAKEARPVSIELGAAEVAALKRVLESFEDGHSEPEAVRESDARKLAARIMFETRKARSRLFPASMFSDPAWDMLIALYIADQAPAAADLARSISASVTTTMRWIEILETHKLIVRERSPTDRRAHTIQLSQQARNSLDTLLSEAVSKWP